MVMLLLFHCHAPMQLVAPRAVTIAVAILAIICTMNLIVSLFVIVGFIFKWLILIFVVTIPHTLCHLERSRALGFAAWLVQEISF